MAEGRRRGLVVVQCYLQAAGQERRGEGEQGEMEQVLFSFHQGPAPHHKLSTL